MTTYLRLKMIKFGKIGFFLFLFGLILNIKIIAQPPCVSNPVAGDYCSTATPICNLNGYCGNTSSSYSNNVSPTNSANETNTPLGNVFCATIQNNSWLKFIADSTTAIFNVWVSNCQNGKGIQMQIYSTTDCYNFTGVSNCWNPGIPTNGTIQANNLVPGNVYYFMIDGTQGDVCDYVIAANVGVNSTPTVTPPSAICFGDSINLNATGGASFLWSSTPTDVSLTGQNTQSSVHVNPSQTTTYNVIITKAGNNAFCPNNVTSLNTSVRVKPNPDFNLISENDHCNLHDGKVEVYMNNHNGSFQYNWNSGSTSVYDSVILNLTAGNYIVTVTDTNACNSIDSVILINDTVLNPVIQSPSYICAGNSDTLSLSQNYQTYTWNTGSHQAWITAYQEGTYWVSVTYNNCKGLDSVFLDVDTVPKPSIIAPDYICFQDTVFLKTDSSFYAYLWNGQDTSSEYKIFNGGNISIKVFDSLGCFNHSSINIPLKYGPVVNFVTTKELCDKQNGSAKVEIIQSAGECIYQWNTGQNSDSVYGLAAGIYYVTITDTICPTKTFINIYEIQGPTANFVFNPTHPTIKADPVEVNFTDISVGNINNWTWDFGDGTLGNYGQQISHYYQNTGDYNIMLIVSDTNNCVDTIYKKLSIVEDFQLYVPNAFSPDGDGINDLFFATGMGVDINNFSLGIFNRWGEMVFETKEWNGFESGKWNGTKSNISNDITQDVYAWRILLTDQLGIQHERYGKVLLIR